ncbi:MAG: class I SAM-dependent methyltransferase [Spirochaetaceae bacterium]|nr:MAG: class I SAM-dependent methyltransferase [Spirochaetaceae bacterium]
MGGEKPWHEDETFWKETLPILFPESRIQEGEKEAEQVLDLAGIHPGAAVLDLCCGVGRHSLALARRGLRVTGVDRTQIYLDRAATAAKRENLSLELVCEDMRRFRREEGFDAVLNLFTSFGYFEDPEDDQRVADNIYASLWPGGVLVMQLMSKEVLARTFRPRDWYEQDGLLVLEERKVKQSWSWIESRWTLISAGRRVDLDLSHRLYSASELATLLRDRGFTQVVPYGDLDASPYDEKAKRLVVVARKE